MDRMAAVVGVAQAVATAQTPTDAARASVAPARSALGAVFAVVAAREEGRTRPAVLAVDGTAPADDPWAADEPPPLRRRGGGLRRGGRALSVPVLLHGRVWGELYVVRGAAEPDFVRADAEFAGVLAALIAAGVAQTERLEEARRLAFTDPLTGLANRRAVDVRLEDALRRHRDGGTAVSLVVCDVNGLKRVNDSLGHAVGDRLLAGFGSVLSLCAATLPGSVAARLGGDEFCLVVEGVPAAEVEATARRLCERARWLGLGDGVAVGVASTDGGAGPVRTARRLFRLADAAQYRAKAERSAAPVVAGRRVAALADDPAPAGGDRRAFRGRAGPADPGPADPPEGKEGDHRTM